jgi:thiazolinyl imide reductase
MGRRYNVVICGTRYGHIYISAFVKDNPRFRLAGIVGKGSDRSQQYAKQFGVPFYHDIDELPSGIDIACVVVKSKVMGGEGTQIALRLLERGINVIQEHPVHPGELGNCFEQAKRNGVCYHVNSQYVNVGEVETFIDYIKKAVSKQRPVYVDATTALIYSTLDIIGTALGDLAPYHFSPPFANDPESEELNSTGLFPFKSLQGVAAGVPLAVKLQDFQDPDDLDNNFLTMCRISVGFESGTLTLMDVYGPVIWCSAYSVPEYIEQVDRPSFNERKMVFSKYRKPASVSFSRLPAPGWNVIVNSHWPDAVLRALEKIRHEIETGQAACGQTEKYLTNLSRAWIEIMRRFGNPLQVSLAKAPPAYPDPLEFSKTVYERLVTTKHH